MMHPDFEPLYLFATAEPEQFTGFLSYIRVPPHKAKDASVFTRQQEAIEGFAREKKLPVVGFFGGTYAAWRGDEFEEIKRLTDFLEQNREPVSHMLVYSPEILCRAYHRACEIAEVLKKYGVKILFLNKG